MVGIQSEIGAIKIGPKMYSGLYNNKALPLLGRVIAFNLVVVSRCIGDNIFLAFLIKLTKNSSNIKSTLISVYMKTLLKLGFLKMGNSESFSLSVLKAS